MQDTADHTLKIVLNFSDSSKITELETTLSCLSGVEVNIEEKKLAFLLEMHPDNTDSMLDFLDVLHVVNQDAVKALIGDSKFGTDTELGLKPVESSVVLDIHECLELAYQVSSSEEVMLSIFQNHQCVSVNASKMF